jgi:hypothetical protein
VLEGESQTLSKPVFQDTDATCTPVVAKLDMFEQLRWGGQRKMALKVPEHVEECLVLVVPGQMIPGEMDVERPPSKLRTQVAKAKELIRT